MCDTFVALPNLTRSGHLIFGKNSDREPNEAQAIVRIPAMHHRKPDVHCTYISIPQAPATFEVILSKPFHMWGAEMGANEHGLAIGNEAVFTKIKHRKKNDGLTGMDMLRLSLERCQTAEEALETIAGLLTRYGQDACGGYRDKGFFYDNSFLIADPGKAWVLETAGRHWAAQKVKTGFRSISNILTIEEDYDRLSDGAADFARKKGWLKKGGEFSFKKSFSSWFYTKLARSNERQCTSTAIGGACPGAFDVASAIELLSTHHPPGEEFSPGACTTASLCMHATGIINRSQTTGSMIAELRKDSSSTIWLTGTSMPCLSVYLPFFFSGETLTGDDWQLPGAKPDESLWWQAEQLHREVAKDYWLGLEVFKKERKLFQEELLECPYKDRNDFSKVSLEKRFSLLKKWKTEVAELELKERSINPFYLLFKHKINLEAGIQV